MIPWWPYAAAVIALGLAAVWIIRWSGQRTRQDAKRRASLYALTESLIWDGVFEWVDGNLVSTLSVELTPLAARLFGGDRRPESGWWWSGFDVPEREEMIARCRSALGQNLSSYEQEFEVRKSGQSFWIRENVAISMLSPQRFRLIGIATDVTSQRAVETARRMSEERVRQLLSRSDCMLWQADVTRTAEGLFEWKWFIPESELYRRVGGKTPTARMPWDTVMVPEYAEMEVRSRSAMLEGKPSYEQEFRVVQEGSVLWLHEQVIVRSLASNRWMLEGMTFNITAQREAEDAKRVSEAQMQRVLDSADFLLWNARVFEGADGQLHWVVQVPNSRLYRRLFGRNPSEPDLLPWKDFVPGKGFQEMTHLAQQRIRSGAERYEQVIHGGTGGQWFWLHEQATIKQIGASEWQLVGIVTDVTASHQAEEARQASERALREILESADCMLWRASVKSKAGVLEWSHFALPASRLRTELLGQKIEGHTDQLWDWVDVPDLAEMNAHSDRAILSGATGYEQQFRAVRDGRMFWLQERVSILPVGLAEWRLVGVITDITQRHEAMEARRASEARLEELLRRVDCMIWQGHVTRSEDGGLKWHLYIPHSHLYRRIFGHNPDGLGFRWKEIGVPEYPAMHERGRTAIFEHRPGYEQVFHIPKPEGNLWLNEQVTISPNGENQWDVVGIITDISAQREAEDVKRTTEAQLQQILSMADCMVWRAEVTLTPEDELLWQIYTPQSVLHRRLFGEDEATNAFNWDKLNVPERAEMTLLSESAIRAGKSGYDQEFRVVYPQRVVWLREAVTISHLSERHWRLVGVITDITAQREAQEAHKMSEAQVEQMLEAVECLLWQARVFQDGPGELRWVMFIPPSRLYHALFLRDPEQPARLHWRDAVDKATNAEIDRRAYEHIFAGSRGYEQEFRAQQGPRSFWLHEQVSIEKVGPGEWKLVGVITDLTARREAEEAMRASELRYRTLYQHIPMAIIEADFTAIGHWLQELRQAGVVELAEKLDAEPLLLLRAATQLQFVDCNDTAMSMLRAKRKSDFRRRRGLLATAQSMGAIKAVVFAIWEGRNTFEMEVEMRDFEGQRHEVHLRWWMERTAGKLDFAESVFVLVDLTRLKETEAALAAEKERLAVTLRAMAEGVITTDVEGVVQFINPAAAGLARCRSDWAIGRVVTEICRFENEGTGEKVEIPVVRVAMTDRVIDLPAHTKLVGAEPGGDRLVKGCCAPIHSATGAVIGTVLVFRDVTEHERFEQELVRATRLEAVGVLAGGIAHDFNNILTVVLGNVALAAMELDPKTAAGRSLCEAEKATLRARDLTQQLLTFAKGGEPVRAAIRLEGVVREISTFTLHGSNVKPVFKIAGDLWPADADKGQIGRVVQNLVINAVQAMPEGGTITLTLSNHHVDSASRRSLAPGDYVQIEIADTGVGIKSENLPRIFDPYFTTKELGSGLGLAAVYSIVKKHRGTIDVDSQLGVGTTFRIWLPASPVKLTPEGTPIPWGQKVALEGRVLFMDDEESIRQMASALLGRFGFNVVCAHDGADAVEKYRQAKREGNPFQLVIVDLTVPGGMGGREAVAQLRAFDPQVRAVVSSGYSSDPVLANYREHGFVGVVAKPYEMVDLARVLRDVLAAPIEPPGK